MADHGTPDALSVVFVCKNIEIDAFVREAVISTKVTWIAYDTRVSNGGTKIVPYYQNHVPGRVLPAGGGLWDDPPRKDAVDAILAADVIVADIASYRDAFRIWGRQDRVKRPTVVLRGARTDCEKLFITHIGALHVDVGNNAPYHHRSSPDATYNVIQQTVQYSYDTTETITNFCSYALPLTGGFREVLKLQREQVLRACSALLLPAPAPSCSAQGASSSSAAPAPAQMAASKLRVVLFTEYPLYDKMVKAWLAKRDEIELTCFYREEPLAYHTGIFEAAGIKPQRIDSTGGEPEAILAVLHADMVIIEYSVYTKAFSIILMTPRATRPYIAMTRVPNNVGNYIRNPVVDGLKELARERTGDERYAVPDTAFGALKHNGMRLTFHVLPDTDEIIATLRERRVKALESASSAPTPPPFIPCCFPEGASSSSAAPVSAQMAAPKLQVVLITEFPLFDKMVKAWLAKRAEITLTCFYLQPAPTTPKPKLDICYNLKGIGIKTRRIGLGCIETEAIQAVSRADMVVIGYSAYNYALRNIVMATSLATRPYIAMTEVPSVSDYNRNTVVDGLKDLARNCTGDERYAVPDTAFGALKPNIMHRTYQVLPDTDEIIAALRARRVTMAIQARSASQPAPQSGRAILPPLNVVFISSEISFDNFFSSVWNSKHKTSLTWITMDNTRVARTLVTSFNVPLIRGLVETTPHDFHERQRAVDAITNADVLVVDVWSYTAAYLIWAQTKKRPFVILGGVPVPCIETYLLQLRQIGEPVDGFPSPYPDATWNIPRDKIFNLPDSDDKHRAKLYCCAPRVLPKDDGFVRAVEILQERADEKMLAQPRQQNALSQQFAGLNKQELTPYQLSSSSAAPARATASASAPAPSPSSTVQSSFQPLPVTPSPLHVVFISREIVIDDFFTSVRDSMHDTKITWITHGPKDNNLLVSYDVPIYHGLWYNKVSKEVCEIIERADVLVVDLWSYAKAHTVWSKAMGTRPFVVLRGVPRVFSANMYPAQLADINEGAGYWNPLPDATWGLPRGEISHLPESPDNARAVRYCVRTLELQQVNPFAGVLKIFREREGMVVRTRQQDRPDFHSPEEERDWYRALESPTTRASSSSASAPAPPPHATPRDIRNDDWREWQRMTERLRAKTHDDLRDEFPEPEVFGDVYMGRADTSIDYVNVTEQDVMDAEELLTEVYDDSGDPERAYIACKEEIDEEAAAVEALLATIDARITHLVKIIDAGIPVREAYIAAVHATCDQKATCMKIKAALCKHQEKERQELLRAQEEEKRLQDEAEAAREQLMARARAYVRMAIVHGGRTAEAAWKARNSADVDDDALQQALLEGGYTIPEDAFCADADKPGCSTSEAAPTTPSSDDDAKLCVICMDEPRAMVVTPCGHMCLCEGCSKNLKPPVGENKPLCPVCRGTADLIVKVYE